MKNALVGLIALILIALAWIMWPGANSVDGGVDGEGVGGAQSSVERGPGDLSADRVPDREAVKSPVGVPEKTGPNGSAHVDAGSELGTLELRVFFREDKKPAPGVRLLVLRRASSWDDQKVVRSGPDGVAKITGLSPGAIYVKALRGGEGQFRVAAGRTTKGFLGIPAGVAVQVTVVDADDAPVEKAKVWLSERWRNNRGAVAGVTDRLGELALEHVSPHCSIAVRRAGFEPSRLYRIRSSLGSSAKIRVVLKRGGGMVSGEVVDLRGRPVPEAQVLIGTENPAYDQRAADGSWLPGAPPITRVTDEEGRFSADASTLGRVTIQVRHLDFAPWFGEFESQPGAPVTERIVMQPGTVLFGRVTGENGDAVPFAQVSVGNPSEFSGRSELADRSGHYEIRGIASGEQVAHAVKQNRETEATLRLGVGARVEWNPVLLAQTGAIGKTVLTGRVVDNQDQPLWRWRVAARGKDAAKPVSTTTDVQGRFKLAIPWDGEMRVWTHARGRHSEYPALIKDGVRVEHGDLLLRVEDAALRCGTIRGFVVDSAGQPVQAQIQTWHLEVKLWRQFKTDARTGEFRVENVPPGGIELKITSESHPWRKLANQSVVAGQVLDVDRIVMQSGGRIEGQLRVVVGRPPEKADIGVFSKTGEEAAVVTYVDGKYRSGILAPGTYFLVATADRFARLQQSAEVTAGGVQVVDLTLQPAALREIKFTLAAGATRPRFLSFAVRTKKTGQLVWNDGFGPEGTTDSSISVLPGDYTIHVFGPNQTSWLRGSFTVASLADARPIEFILKPIQ